MLKIIKIILFIIYFSGFAYGQVNINSMKPVLQQEGKAGETLGCGAVGLGDINGDGYPDFAIGAQGVNKLYIYFGGPGILDGEPDIKLDGGEDVLVGDINGDGLKDIISQKYGIRDTFFIYLGKKTSKLLIDTIPALFIAGQSRDVGFGSYKAVGDLNGDGMDDFVTTVPEINDPLLGTQVKIYIWMGKKTPNKDQDFTIQYGLPFRVSSNKIVISDVNGDGIGDLITCTRYSNFSVDPPNQPIDYYWFDIYYGKKNFTLDINHPNQHIDSRIWGMKEAWFFGTSFIDLNGDGISDMLCIKNKDTLCLFYGRKDSFRLKEDRILTNYDSENVTMSPVAFQIGDINHDGYKDYATRCSKPGLPGLIFYLGGPKGISKDPIAVAYKACDNGWWGKWTSNLGDINGDGYDEVITTSPYDCVTYPVEWGYFAIMTGWSDFKLEVKNKSEPVPNNFNLNQNYPNPFNSSTVIKYTVETNGRSSRQIIIYDILGNEIIKLVDEDKLPGEYSVRWDGKNTNGINVPSGTYFYKLFVNNKVVVNKMIMLH